MQFLIVFLGAGLGGICRHGVNLLAERGFGTAFPLATMAVNIVGSTLIGLLAALLIARPEFDPRLRLFLATGLLGGFTTFSAFTQDAAMLLDRGQLALFGTYVLGSVALGLIGFFAGIALAR